MKKLAVLIAALLVPLSWAILAGQLPAIGAGGMLRPSRRHVSVQPPTGCEDAHFAGEEVTLMGWRCAAQTSRRGTLVYLHGIAARPGPVLLMGSSLGAAVALQESADDPRISAIVAAEPFSDLRTVATERAPFIFTRSLIDRAFDLAEHQGHFTVDDVSPVNAAARIRVPVLLVHGAADIDTPPAHSRRIFAALAGPKRLIEVPGAHHNESLSGAVWNDVERWIDEVIPDVLHLSTSDRGCPASGCPDPVLRPFAARPSPHLSSRIQD